MSTQEQTRGLCYRSLQFSSTYLEKSGNNKTSFPLLSRKRLLQTQVGKEAKIWQEAAAGTSKSDYIDNNNLFSMKDFQQVFSRIEDGESYKGSRGGLYLFVLICHSILRITDLNRIFVYILVKNTQIYRNTLSFLPRVFLIKIVKIKHNF